MVSFRTIKRCVNTVLSFLKVRTVSGFFATVLFPLYISIFMASCVENEEPPSGLNNDNFYVRMPENGDFYIGSEVLLRGRNLTKITNIYTEGMDPEFDWKNFDINDYPYGTDENFDDIPDELQIVESRIISKTENELVFIVPAGTFLGNTMLYFDRGNGIEKLNRLNYINDYDVYITEDIAGVFWLSINGGTPSEDDKVYVQHVNYFDVWQGVNSGIGPVIELPIEFMNENALAVKPKGLGDMIVTLFRNGEFIRQTKNVYLDPMYFISFPQNVEFFQGDMIAISGGCFMEDDVITLNDVPVEIISVNQTDDTLIFRIPNDCLGYQEVKIYRYNKDFYITEIYVREKAN